MLRFAGHQHEARQVSSSSDVNTPVSRVITVWRQAASFARFEHQLVLIYACRKGQHVVPATAEAAAVAAATNHCHRQQVSLRPSGTWQPAQTMSLPRIHVYKFLMASVHLCCRSSCVTGWHWHMAGCCTPWCSQPRSSSCSSSQGSSSSAGAQHSAAVYRAAHALDRPWHIQAAVSRCSQDSIGAGL